MQNRDTTREHIPRPNQRQLLRSSLLTTNIEPTIYTDSIQLRVNTQPQQISTTTTTNSSILSPGIHSRVQELLSPNDYLNAPTTQLVDNLISHTYLSPRSVQTHSLDESGIQSGPASLIFNQSYSISPNNLYKSIVITQLRDKIRSKDDLDIQIVNPNELHLIATNKSLKECEEINNHFTKRSQSETRFKENDSVQCQTDMEIPIGYREICTPSMAETQTLGFYYVSDEDRIRQLELLMSDKYDQIVDKYEYDPCIEFESILREASKERRPESSGYSFVRSFPRSKSSPVKHQSTNTESDTKFNKNLIKFGEEPKSTQTSPELLRRYMLSNFSSTSSDSANSSPKHQIIKAKTVALFEKDEETELINKISETFTIKNKGIALMALLLFYFACSAMTLCEV